MKKTLLCAIALAFVAVASTGCSSSASNQNETTETQTADATAEAATDAATAATAAPAEDVITVTDDNLFRPGKAVDKLTVLDFNATWCVPCKKLTPAYHEAAAQLGDKVAFYSVDIDQNPQTKEAFGVNGVPTVVIIAPNGKMESYVGLGPFLGNEQPDGDLTPILLKNLLDKIEEIQK